MNIELDTKWECEKCTYLNWSSSQKCTICRTAKPLHLVLGGNNLQRRTQDIYELAPPPVAASDSSVIHDESTNPVEAPDAAYILQQQQVLQKWACDACTYLNWPRSLKCVQCQTPRGKDKDSSTNPIMMMTSSSTSRVSRRSGSTMGSTPFNNSPPHGHQAHHLVGAGDDKNNSAALISTSRGSSGSGPHEGPKSPNSPDSTGQGPSTVLDSRIIAKKLQKWTCDGCTYENWPKAHKCVMCYTPRNTTNCSGGGSTRILANSGTSTTCVVSKTGAGKVRTPQSPLSPPCAGTDHRTNVVPATTGSSSPGENEKKRSLSSGKDGGRKSPKNGSSTESVNSSESTTTMTTTGTVIITTGSVVPANSRASTSKSVVVSPPISYITCSTVTSTSSAISAQMPQIGPLAASASPPVTLAPVEESKYERHLKKLRRQLKDVDYLWLKAVRSIFVDGSIDCDAIEAFIAAGGDVARTLTPYEAQLFNSSFRGVHFESGHTLVHLAVRHRREDLLSFLLACTDQPSGGRRVKKVPCHLSPDAAADIRRQVAMSLRQRKGDMSCYFFSDLMTFCLPSAIYNLPPPLQEKLFDELLDRGVQKELEEEYLIINWSIELTDRLSSRLFALWNRTAGDCLLDSVLQATWGVFDSENSLRQALSDSLSDAANMFYPRWREFETCLADVLHFTIDEDQFTRDWDLILQMASKPGSALEQVHIFALAHIIRRPIVVYGVRIVKSFRGESIDYARFEGLYLPLLWEPSFCWRSPICLGYTRGHFCALVPIEPEAFDYVSITRTRDYNNQQRQVYLPLQDADGQMLPIHFLTSNERGHEQSMLRSWLDVGLTDGGLLCCKMRMHRLPSVTQQMVDDWLDYYRRLGQMQQAAGAALARSRAAKRVIQQPSSHQQQQQLLTSQMTSGQQSQSQQPVLMPIFTTASAATGNDVITTSSSTTSAINNNANVAVTAPSSVRNNKKREAAAAAIAPADVSSSSESEEEN